MKSVGDLVNKGFIVNWGSDKSSGRTFIVTGLERSGTSLVAAVLQHMGIFIGSEINDAVYEDEEISRLLAARDMATLQRVISARNTSHRLWGFKEPMLWNSLGPEQMDLFEHPRLIVMFRDPVAMAVRRSLSEYQDPLRSLRSAIGDQVALMEFVDQITCPNLLLSYEKAPGFPQDFIDSILQFCRIPFSAALRTRLLDVIEPNRPRYLVTARRPFEGCIEGVRGGELYGWCWLLRLPEPVTLEVLVDDRLALSTVANSFRQDLLDAGIGNGRHGYFVPLGELHARPDSLIRVRVARYNVELVNSGTRLCDFGSTPA